MLAFRPRGSIVRILHTILISTAIAMSAGCALRPATSARAAPPGAFENGNAAVPAHWPELDWYRTFGSAELDALMQTAAQENLDLAAAGARVRQADARVRMAGAALLPQVDGNGNIVDVTGGSHGQSAHETDWSALLSASYEVDFWGKNRNAARSADQLRVASQADRDTVRLTTLAAVANGYFQVLSLRERLELARSTLGATQNELQVIETRYQAGLASPGELASQRAAVANAQILIPQLQQDEWVARASLADLIGRNPEDLKLEAGQSLEPLMEPVVAPGLPSELLTRRPDISAAEAQLQAAPRGRRSRSG
jgi:multidrug efflux system outer membrane protein